MGIGELDFGAGITRFPGLVYQEKTNKIDNKTQLTC